MSIICIFIFIVFCYMKTSKSWILRTPVHYNDYYSRYNGSNQLYAKKKAGRVLVTLECSISRKLGVPPSRYYTTKNKINTPQRLELMKYNKFLRKHTLHKEIR